MLKYCKLLKKKHFIRYKLAVRYFCHIFISKFITFLFCLYFYPSLHLILKKGNSMFTLPAQLTIAQVDECKTQLLKEISESHDISFDDSEVTSIDAVGVQLLLAAVTYIASQNKVLNWNSQSTVIQQSVKQLGLNEAILNQYLNI